MRIDSPSLVHGTGSLALAANLPIENLHQEVPKIRLSQTVVSSAVVSATVTIPSGFLFYELLIKELAPETVSTNLRMRISNDGGATFKSGAADYAWALFGGNSTTGGLNQIDGADSAITLNQVTNGIGNGTNQHYCGRLLLFNASSSVMYTTIHCTAAHVGGTNLQTYANIAGIYQISTTPVDALRFFMSSGNIAQATFTLYGIR